MKISIFCYYGPPIGGGYSERMAAFSRYWAKSGARVNFFTSNLEQVPLPRDFDSLRDLPSNLEFVWIPSLENRLNGWQVGKARNPGALVWRALNKMLPPDASRIWAGDAFKFAKSNQLLDDTDVVFTSSTPYSTHLVGLYAKKEFGDAIKWVADFRDPWTTNYQYSKRLLLPFEREIDRCLEQRVYDLADAVVVNTNQNKKDIFEHFEVDREKFIVAQNGYEPFDLETSKPMIPKDPNRIRIGYVGGLRGDWFEGEFYEALAVLRAEFPAEYERLDVLLAGNDKIPGETHKRLRLHDKLQNLGHFPRSELPSVLSSCDAFLLLLPDNEGRKLGWVPQKLYMYMAANKPIFAIVPDGEAADYIRGFQLGVTVQPGSPRRIASALSLFLKSMPFEIGPNSDLRKLSKPSLADFLLQQFEQLVLRKGS